MIINFQEKVFAITKKIPKGKVSTYKEIAKAIKNPKACRAVGNTLNKNKSKLIPCHRVVRTDGSVGEYNKGVKKKIEILKKEGIEIRNGRINLDKYTFKYK